MADRVLEVHNLRTQFRGEGGEIVPAVDGVSFYVEQEETLGIVGESGCGKSVTSLSVMQLVPNPPGKIVGGEILFNGQDLLKMNADQMRKIRGKDIAMIFQEPMTSLNPVYTVGDQIAEAIMLHQKVDKREAMKRATEMLRLVGIPAPERRVHEYPHALSGGMRQRVMIAMALSCNPKLLIADEPTTALDVTIQAQILELMKDIKQRFHTSIMLITHDLGVVAEMTERVMVMYAGKVVEEAPTVELFEEPMHPYTRGLMNSIPRLDMEAHAKLHVIEGTVPNLAHLPQGCSFAPRCEHAMPICTAKEPVLTPVSDTRKVSCWLHVNHEEAVS